MEGARDMRVSDEPHAAPNDNGEVVSGSASEDEHEDSSAGSSALLSADSDNDEEMAIDTVEDYPHSGSSSMGPSLVERADITPSGKRSQRRTAAAASQVWQRLGPRKYRKRGQASSQGSPEVVIETSTSRKDGKPRQAYSMYASSPLRKSIPSTPSRREKRNPSADTSSSDGSSSSMSSLSDDATDDNYAIQKDDLTQGNEGAATVTPTKHQLVPRTPTKSASSTGSNHASLGTNGHAHASTSKRQLSSPRKNAVKPVPFTPRKRTRHLLSPNSKGKARASIEDALPVESLLGTSLIQPTSSDAYFVNHAPRRATRKQTSDNVISNQLPNVSSRAVASLAKRLAKQVQNSTRDHEKSQPSTQHHFVPVRHYDQFFDGWWGLMRATNRPLLCYGVGSKRAPLQRFARHLARSGRCSAIVVRGEAGGKMEEVIQEMERSCGATPSAEEYKRRRTMGAGALDVRAAYLVEMMDKSGEADGVYAIPHPPNFLIVIHNIDTLALVQERSLHLLGLLARSRRVHLVADTAHINASMLAHAIAADADGSTLLPWLWIDLTTYIPMLDELLGERAPGTARQLGLPSVLDIRTVGGGLDVGVLAYGVGEVGAGRDNMPDHQGSSRTASGAPRHLSDRAAVHILRSVTFKARGLFLLLAGRLLQQTPEGGATKTTAITRTTYGELAQLARSNFLAMTPDALRSLLIEFTSHGLVYISSSSSSGGSEGATAHTQGSTPAIPQSLQPLDLEASGAHEAGSGIVHIALSRNDLARVFDEFKAKA